MLSSFSDQVGVRTFSSSWDVKHLENRGTDIWCTIYFDPIEVTVFASADGYHETEDSLVCRYRHGISDMTANGSVYLELYNGRYRIDELSLTQPRGRP